MNILYFICWKI